MKKLCAGLKNRALRRRRAVVQAFTTANLSFCGIRALFVSALVEQLVLLLIPMLSTGFISASGESTLAHVGLIDPINALVNQIYYTFAVTLTIFTAVRRSRARAGFAFKALFQLNLMALAGAFILTVLAGFYSEEFLARMYSGIDVSMLPEAAWYLRMSVFSGAFLAVIAAVSGALRGRGDMRAALTINFIWMLSFLLLTILLVGVLGCGVRGVGWAVLLSKVLACIWIAAHAKPYWQRIFRHFRSLLRPDFRMLAELLKTSVPFLLEAISFSVVILFIQMILARIGVSAIVIYTIVSSVLGFMSVPGLGMQTVALSVVAAQLGAGDVEGARRLLRSCVRGGMVLNLLAGLLVLLGFPLLMAFFAPPAALNGNILLNLILYCVFNALFWPGSFVLPSGFRSAGDRRFPALSALLMAWIVRLPLAYFLGLVLEWGATGVVLAMCLDWVARCLLFSRRFRSGRWLPAHT